jgi:hypothetical protein
MEGVVEHQVPMDKASDSWFPGYSWSIVACSACDGPKHLGWRFEPITAAAGPGFYALIVDYADGEGEKAAAGAELDADRLSIGVPAPAWMTALLGLTQLPLKA